jgi:hypothetical protein
MKKNVLLLILCLMSFNCLSEEFKDIKFFSTSRSCLIPKKEVQQASGYVPKLENEKNQPLKLALTIFQMRTSKGKSFEEVDCAIRYFYDTLKANVKTEDLERGNNISFELKSIVKDYIFNLEKARLSEKYKAKFNKEMSNDNIFKNYFEVCQYFPELMDLLEENLARRFYENIFIKMPSVSISQDELKLLNRFYFSKKLSLPPTIKENFRTRLIRTFGPNNKNFIAFYLNFVDDYSYQVFYKDFFESFSTTEIKTANYIDLSNWPKILPVILDSKYFPEDFKCSLVKAFFSNYSRSLRVSDIEEFKKINHPCVAEIAVYHDRFKDDLVSCPEFQLKSGDNFEEVVKQAHPEFSRKWLSCRNMCKDDNECIETKQGSAIYINSKYKNDVNHYSYLKNYLQIPNFNSSNNSEKLKYEFKSSGACLYNNCAEQVPSCSINDLISKVENELKEAGYKDCKVDQDCFPLYYPDDCKLSAVNQFVNNGQVDLFPMNRLNSLRRQCGTLTLNLPSTYACAKSGTGTQKIKCESNLCVVKE